MDGGAVEATSDRGMYDSQVGSMGYWAGVKWMQMSVYILAVGMEDMQFVLRTFCTCSPTVYVRLQYHTEKRRFCRKIF